MVQIEPEGADFWLLPDEEFNLRAEAEKDNGQFEVQHCHGYVAVFPSGGGGSIGVSKAVLNSNAATSVLRQNEERAEQG